jgi:hypothetical protein
MIRRRINPASSSRAAVTAIWLLFEFLDHAGSFLVTSFGHVSD